MSSLRRLASAVLLATFALVPALHSPGAARAADDAAGQWDFLVVINCAPSAASTCSSVLPPWIDYLVNGAEMQCTDANHCTYRAYLIVHGNGGPAAPVSCSPDIFAAPFQGTCRDTETGTMIVKSGLLNLPEFFITDEMANYYGERNAAPLLDVHDPAGAANYPLDTTTPAVAGFYDTTTNLQLFGILKPGQSAPPGIELDVLVTHTAPGAAQSMGTLALPVITPGPGKGNSPAFIVSSFGSTKGQMQVNFGQGPGCQGLVEVGTQDLYAGFDLHSVLVTGNDLPGTVGNNGIAPGTTYWFEPVTLTTAGPQVDSHGGACYRITIPSA